MDVPTPVLDLMTLLQLDARRDATPAWAGVFTPHPGATDGEEAADPAACARAAASFNTQVQAAAVGVNPCGWALLNLVSTASVGATTLLRKVAVAHEDKEAGGAPYVLFGVSFAGRFRLRPVEETRMLGFGPDPRVPLHARLLFAEYHGGHLGLPDASGAWERFSDALYADLDGGGPLSASSIAAEVEAVVKRRGRHCHLPALAPVVFLLDEPAGDVSTLTATFGRVPGVVMTDMELRTRCAWRAEAVRLAVLAAAAVNTATGVGGAHNGRGVGSGGDGVAHRASVVVGAHRLRRSAPVPPPPADAGDMVRLEPVPTRGQETLEAGFVVLQMDLTQQLFVSAM